MSADSDIARIAIGYIKQGMRPSEAIDRAKMDVMLSGSSSGSKFKEGDRVILKYGHYPDSDDNPVWGHNGRCVAGIIDDCRPYAVGVRWDNGCRNQYNEDQLEYFTSAPKPKRKKVTLDTTKLDALVMNPETKQEIVAVLNQHQHGDKLFDEWGLGDVIEYGRGMTFMFWGGPGTGKTFGARCIAKALNKDLLVIGAAEIQSQEPGGANRNIQNAFADAKSKGKVLFIDECDSLIFNRASLGMILGSEVNTLLTEIEKSEEVVILATNRISDMDPALERRLSLIVEFPMPDLEQRILIWKNLLPEKMPLDVDVKVEELAKAELTGGLIKNIVLQAARLALANNEKNVSMKYFTKAMDRVKSAQGLMGKKRIQHDGMSVDRKVELNKTIKETFETYGT